jgi:hypothetical protein
MKAAWSDAGLLALAVGRSARTLRPADAYPICRHGPSAFPLGNSRHVTTVVGLVQRDSPPAMPARRTTRSRRGSYRFDRALAAASHCGHLSGCERPVGDHIADEVVLRGSEVRCHAFEGPSARGVQHTLCAILYCTLPGGSVARAQGTALRAVVAGLPACSMPSSTDMIGSRKLVEIPAQHRLCRSSPLLYTAGLVLLLTTKHALEMLLYVVMYGRVSRRSLRLKGNA